MQPYGESLCNVNNHLLTYFLCVYVPLEHKLFKRRIKNTDVKIKQKQPSSHVPENQPVFTNRGEGSHSVTFHKIICSYLFYWTQNFSRNVSSPRVLALPVCRTMKEIVPRSGIMEKEKSFVVSVPLMPGPPRPGQFLVKCLVARK